MNTTIEGPSITEPARVTAPRVISIDVFRGLSMVVMIFVNELSEVRGLPWWTYHAPARVDVMTYVDMVFPFFLFALGMSLPLSITQRLKRNPSTVALWAHIAARVLGLIVLGLILANADQANAARMGMSGDTWGLLSILCAALYLNVYPEWKRFKPYSRILRVLGLAGVVILLAIFRRTADGGGHVAWLDGSYPEILGLIGYSYLAVAILYIPTRRWPWAAPTWFVLLVSLCALSTARLITFPVRLPLYLWPFGNGAMCCIVMAGVVTSLIFLRPDRRAPQSKGIMLASGFVLLVLVAGRVLTPLGISKIRATPTWSLYSIGAAVILFCVLYWICDVKRSQRWAFFVRAAGSNTLLTYLVPDLWYFLWPAVGLPLLANRFNLGWPGVVKTVVFTCLMLAIAEVLTRAKVRLQL